MSTGLEKPRRFKFYIRPTNVIKEVPNVCYQGQLN